jgi:NAD(P)H-flavin reductase
MQKIDDVIEPGVPATADTLTEPMLPSAYRVERVRRDTSDTFTLALAPADGSALPRSQPGQFNMLYIFGVGEAPISISSEPGRTLLHTTREVGGVTRAMARLRKGDSLGVRGPYGTGWPLAAAHGKDVVIIAGGIGLAPLRGALLELLKKRRKLRRIILIYGARTPDDLLYRAELDRLRHRGLDLFLTVDRATAPWNRNVGVVTTLISRAPFDPHNCIAFMCGPEIMMRFSAMELHHRGVPESSIHVSLERNMKCAIGFCGHCQFGPHFICKTGPVFAYDRVRDLMEIREL